ncbi:hypothetical protein [Fibrobacter sp.]|uniref:hypothetical protein n=1 Tax=Fibrobacter sp. TaxID=35828 RepID=UPI00388DD0AA
MEIENQEQEIQMSPELYLGVVSLVTSVNGQIGDVVLTASDVNALSDTTLYAAALSLTINPTTYVLTGQLLDQNGDNLGEAQSIDLPLESMVVGGEYDSTTKSVILTLKNGQTVAFSVADLVSGLQAEITQNNKLASDLVDDTNQTNKFITEVLLDKLNDLVLIKSIGDGLDLDANGELSAPEFTGTDGTAAGVAGIVPAPAATDADKFLKSDGTWDVAGVSPVQTTGTSTTDVMSQKATTTMVYSDKNTSTWTGGGAVYIGNINASQVRVPDPSTSDRHWKYFYALPGDNTKLPSNNTIAIMGYTDSINATGIALGSSTDPAILFGNSGVAIGVGAKTAQQSIAIGTGALAGDTNTNETGQIAIGSGSKASQATYSIHLGANTSSSYGVRNINSTSSIAIGKNSSVGDASTGYANSVALGAYSHATRQGEVNIGLVNGETTGGYNNTAYRVIGGVHDGQLAQDAVTVSQVNATIDAINAALNTSIPHIGA